jgi:hypothetical protein
MSYDPPGEVWFVFGTSTKDSTVDIADSENDTLFTGVPPHLAEQICEKHNAAVRTVLDYYKKVGIR